MWHLAKTVKSTISSAKGKVGWLYFNSTMLREEHVYGYAEEIQGKKYLPLNKEISKYRKNEGCFISENCSTTLLRIADPSTKQISKTLQILEDKIYSKGI